MTQAVWTACAIDVVHEDREPLVVVGVSSQDAEEKLDNKISEQLQPEMWIAYHPVEHELPEAMEN